MKRYNPADIESKWQKIWEETGVYRAKDDAAARKNYILDYFPYPSGAAMHVGHVRNYTISDVMARYARMRGDNVLHPMGWDAFGLPAENYAIKTGVSPQKVIADSTAKFKQQLMQMGIGIDWSREINSSDPQYYRWTQWLFNLLLKRGLAYQKESLQWWCPHDKTVLANEQVEAGTCWRCGNEVTKKPLKQWFFKITDYADRLADDLQDLDWSDAIKTMQRNWIGRSKGAEIVFAIDGRKDELRIFTTRPDTLYGVTFMVLAPEHPLVLSITSDNQRDQVQAYIKSTQAKSDIERQETGREKTGVFTGSYAINPVNDQKIPVWIADYVLAGYGTGAIMAVPGHDQRDFEFATRFDLPIIDVVEPVTGTPQSNEETRKSIVAIVRDPKTNQYLSLYWKDHKDNLFVGGGIDQGEEALQAAVREIAEETGYTNLTFVAKTGTLHHHYFSHSKNKPRYIDAQGFLFDLKSDAHQAPQLEEYEKGLFTAEWLPQNEIESKVNDELHNTVYQMLVKGERYHGEGVMVHSGPYSGMASSEVREKIVADLAGKGVGKERISYKIRDWLISRQRYWGAPIPVVYCAKDGVVPVPDDQLPVELPLMESYEPSGDGRSPLARATDWVNTTCPACGGPATRETDTMDGFACSSWYFLRYADPHNNKAAFDPKKVERWLPVDSYVGGAEHAVMHLLYARFWTKVMYDAKLITFSEPFTALRNQGMILAPDGRKMSKSWGNVIAPDDLIADGYGADSIRVMEMFIGPWNQSANWSIEGMGGCFRFLQRAWNITQEYLNGDSVASHPEQEAALQYAAHATIKTVTRDLEELSFNTGVAALMEFVNKLYKFKATFPPSKHNTAWQQAITALVQLLAPYAPHVSEELWHQLGNNVSVHISGWPVWNEAALSQDTMLIVVQVNGKVRAKLQLPTDADQQAVQHAALQDSNVTKFMGTKKPANVVYVPGRLINIVTS